MKKIIFKLDQWLEKKIGWLLTNGYKQLRKEERNRKNIIKDENR